MNDDSYPECKLERKKIDRDLINSLLYSVFLLGFFTWMLWPR